MSMEPRFVVATPIRSVCDENARALVAHGALRFLALGTRRGTAGVPAEITRLFPVFGLMAYAATRVLSWYRAEAFRYALHPLFDQWVRRQLRPGDHVISSYGYANASFRWARAHGGRTFLDGGSSHPEHLWAIMTEEHQRWGWHQPPIARHHYRRAVEMMKHVDFVLTPSRFVADSFLSRGFQPQQMIPNIYPVDLSCFQPSTARRRQDAPLRVITTGSLSLRKGTPYLLEAFRLILRDEPNARLLLTKQVADSAKPLLARYTDLPIDWAETLRPLELAERLKSADVYVQASLEEGLVRTATEALACGLPIVVTPNTGVNDFVEKGVNGTVVPIRDPQALASAVLDWAARRRESEGAPVPFDRTVFSFEFFAARFIKELSQRGFI
jgi:alpha-maltose-1-phosphate synthase